MNGSHVSLSTPRVIIEKPEGWSSHLGHYGHTEPQTIWLP